MILQQSALAVLLISYHPLKGVKFTLKRLIMIFFYKYNTCVFNGFRNQVEGNKNAKENEVIIQSS